MTKQLAGLALNLRSLYNVGSLFRTADAFGLKKLFLVGTTGHPHPDEPWRRDHHALHKTALGAEQTVPWEYQATPLPLLAKLRRAGWLIVCLEVSPRSLPITSWHATSQPTLLVVGNEMTGLPAEILSASHITLQIPQIGQKESLNVGVAFGIAAFWLTQTDSTNSIPIPNRLSHHRDSRAIGPS